MDQIDMKEKLEAMSPEPRRRTSNGSARVYDLFTKVEIGNSDS
jgi:hypothetical protein